MGLSSQANLGLAVIEHFFKMELAESTGFGMHRTA